MAWLLFGLAEVASAGQGQARIASRGTIDLGTAATSAAPFDAGTEIQRTPDEDRAFERIGKGALKPARVPAAHVPTPADTPVAGIVSGAGFDGLTHRDQRLASGGNQFSVEPPDQGLAIGNGYIVEAVNNAIRVRSTSGAIVVPAIGLNAFFKLPPIIDRSASPPVYGPFTSDPKAYFDADLQRWFVSLLEIDTDPATGDFRPHSAVLLAVSKTANPAGAWNLYSIDTTNATGTAAHAGCPCFGDQPLIGADRYGFYVSTNEFPIDGDGFNGAQLYAMSKAKLAAGGALPTVVAFDNLALAEGMAYTVQPAVTAQGGAHALDRNGTEYFLSALDFDSTLDNRIAVWALTNTRSLDDASPRLTLNSAVVASEVYGMPPATRQRPGPTPLADAIESGALSAPKRNGQPDRQPHQPLPLIDSNDDRMQQVTWADGKLWSSLNTVVKPQTGPVHAGSAYFVVAPLWSAAALGGQVVKQGYVSLSNNSAIFPSVGVNRFGRGAMSFTLVGDDYYPSVAYVPIDAVAGAGPITIVAPGAGPDDGFTGYPFYGGRVGRWGDYSAAFADADGTIWFANEYIPNLPRTLLANWGTYIGRVTP